MVFNNGGKFSACWRKLFRIKSQLLNTQIHEGDGHDARYSGVFELSNIGVASTLGFSVYIVAGQTFKDVAGPSAILSVLISALAAAISCKYDIRITLISIKC